jgi:hypothetical protein
MKSQLIKVFRIAPLVLILLAGCHAEQAGKKIAKYDSILIGQKICYLEYISKAYFDSVDCPAFQAGDTLPYDSTVVRKEKSGLRIYLANGKNIFLRNDSSEGDSMAIYKYGLTYQKIHAVLVQVFRWDWSSFLLISLQEGRQCEMWAAPLFSPDMKYLICYSASLSGESANGVQLFHYSDGTGELVFEKNIEQWEPSEIKWASGSTLLIRRKFSGGETDYVSMELAFVQEPAH